MAILRKNKHSNYTVIDNGIFKNRNLSLKAKGLLCLMLSLPDNWEYNLKGLVSLSSDGISSVRGALKELENQMYFKRQRLHENGKLSGVEYIVSETPMCENLILENLKQENLNLGNQPQLNTNKNKVSNEIKEDIIAVVDYLNEKANTSYRPTTKATASVIQARLKEGFTVKDFKTVVDKKVGQWKGTEMEQYLRPQTLFGNKMESYLNQNIIKEEKNEPMPKRYKEFEPEPEIDAVQMPEEIRDKYKSFISGLGKE